MARPHPIPKEMVCSECGLDWDDHPEKPTRSNCIELLKAELERHKPPLCLGGHHHHCNWHHCFCWQTHYYWSYEPYPVTYPQPYQITYTGTPADTTTTFSLSANN